MTGLLKKLGQYLNAKSTKCYALCVSALLANQAHAVSADPGGVFKGLADIIKSYQDLMGGPVGKAIMIGSIMLAVGAWVMTPREGVVSVLVRLVAAGIVIMNAAAIVTALGPGS